MIASESDTRAKQSWGPQALDAVRQARREFQDAHALKRDKWIRSNEYFYDCLKRTLQNIIEPEKRILHVRCETGHLLAAVVPDYGVGVEIGQVMVDYAGLQHPNLRFVRGDPEDLELNEKFDYIIFDHIFDTVDILRAFERVWRHCTDETRVVVINYNHLWQPVLQLATKVGLRSKFVEPNWVSENDTIGFLQLAGFRLVRRHSSVLFPKWLPLFSSLLNKFIARLPLMRHLCLMQIIVARPVPEPRDENSVTVSVIVPCRNERDNVQPAVERIPALGRQCEILFCDDKSTDGTADEVRRMQSLYPDKEIRLIEGPGICKAENVWVGFRAARGDVLMILDADLAVMPEELPVFLRALASRRGDFVNGSRLIYPMQHNSMKLANEVGNKLFGLLFSFLLDQRIKDTLCGTKVLWRRDWLRIEKNLGTWGISDLWGDYELIFGASKLHLEIVEVPIHYQERVHGVTKMTRVFSNGLRMLNICWHAWSRLEG